MRNRHNYEKKKAELQEIKGIITEQISRNYDKKVLIARNKVRIKQTLFFMWRKRASIH